MEFAGDINRLTREIDGGKGVEELGFDGTAIAPTVVERVDLDPRVAGLRVDSVAGSHVEAEPLVAKTTEDELGD